MGEKGVKRFSGALFFECVYVKESSLFRERFSVTYFLLNYRHIFSSTKWHIQLAKLSKYESKQKHQRWISHFSFLFFIAALFWNAHSTADCKRNAKARSNGTLDEQQAGKTSPSDLGRSLKPLPKHLLEDFMHQHHQSSLISYISAFKASHSHKLTRFKHIFVSLCWFLLVEIQVAHQIFPNTHSHLTSVPAAPVDSVQTCCFLLHIPLQESLLSNGLPCLSTEPLSDFYIWCQVYVCNPCWQTNGWDIVSFCSSWWAVLKGAACWTKLAGWWNEDNGHYLFTASRNC